MELRERIGRFARDRIRGRADLQTSESFPLDLWAEMGRESLLGLGLPEVYGGGGADPKELIAAGAALVRGGRNLGVGASWLTHNVVSRFMILGFGNEEQRRRYLPDLAGGRITASVAISEPGAGAHPKLLQTRAVKSAGQFVLEGEKAYLTNGPMADLFVVLAVTGVENERKRFTAFLVPKATPGLSLTQAGSVDFLRPSPHCGLRLEGCQIPPENVLGPEGKAFETMGRPLRDFEDGLAAGLTLGGMEAEVDLLVERGARAEIAINDAMREGLGELRAHLAGVAAVTEAIGDALAGGAWQMRLPTLALAVRRFAGLFQGGLAALARDIGLDGDAVRERLASDLIRFASVGRTAHLARLRQLGAWTPSEEN